MIYRISDATEHEHIKIDNIYKLFIIENVVQYSLSEFNTHHIEVCEKKRWHIRILFYHRISTS
jgi:hypothetical protein